MWGFWARDLQPDEVRDLVTVAASDKDQAAVFARLAFLDQYVGERPESLEQLRSTAEEVLKESVGYRFGTMDGHHWRRLAENTFADDPVAMAHLGVSAAAEVSGRAGLLDDEVRQLLLVAISKASSVEQVKILEEVLGPALVSTPSLLWVLESPFERDFLDQFDPEIVVQWIEEDVERRLPLIVHAVSVGDQSLASLARAILTRYRHRKDVRSALGATFGTGGWMGSESEWRAGKVSQLEEWAKDPNPNVRQWALELKQYHLNNLKRAQPLNEEEDSR